MASLMSGAWVAMLYPHGYDGGVSTLFDEETELPPTWVEGSDVFHTTEKCQRLQAIPRSRRVSGKPGIKLRLCYNCEDIVRTKRSG